LDEAVTLEILCAPDLWPIRADVEMFEKIVLSLAVNARDAMPSGGTLRLHATNIMAAECKKFRDNSVPAADYVAIEVTDTGTGIAADMIDRIFEPFFSTKSGRGNGTGLMAVYGTIKQMNGHILVESEIGKGAIFRIYVPRHVPIMVDQNHT
jgi:two-component system cell cycle sensor histidine kinase/response regulator CckA